MEFLCEKMKIRRKFCKERGKKRAGACKSTTHTETLDRVAHKRRDEYVSLLLNRIKKLQPSIYEKALNPKYKCYVQWSSVKPL